jgi:hypothetical protein
MSAGRLGERHASNQWVSSGYTEEREYGDMGAPVSTALFTGDFVIVGDE